MLPEYWGVVWRIQKTPHLLVPRQRGTRRADAAGGRTLDALDYLTARTSFWLSFPMLFFMAAASHYPFLSTVAH